MADHELMLEQKRFRSHGAYATWTEQLREGYQEVDDEDQGFAHGANSTITGCPRKTARRKRIPSNYEFACDTRLCRGVVSTETEGTICVTR